MVLQGEALGTTWMVRLIHPADPAAARSAIERTLAEVDEQMSTYRPDSELMALNAHKTTAPRVASPELSALIEESLAIGRASNGAFDITVGPMVDAWGFGWHRHDQMPSVEQIARLRDRVGLDKLTLRDGRVQKVHPETTVDLSAIAKGHAVDRVASSLAAQGHSDLLVEIGGEFVAWGHNAQGEPWRLGIERPSESERTVYDSIELHDAAMATSGDYRNVRFVGGRRISHLLDPRTGRPVDHHLASVTVIAPSCATADAWATALLVLGEEEGLKVAEARGLAAYFIIRAPDGSFTYLTTTAFDALREGRGAHTGR
jgi:thiamine biosynthesis lipoprotein